MTESSDLRMARIPINNGAGHMPVLGFGTLIPDAALTITATRHALPGDVPFENDTPLVWQTSGRILEFSHLIERRNQSARLYGGEGGL